MDGVVQWQASQNPADSLSFLERKHSTRASKSAAPASECHDPPSSPSWSSTPPPPSSKPWEPSQSAIQAMTRPRPRQSLLQIPSWSAPPQGPTREVEEASRRKDSLLRNYNRENISKSGVRKVASTSTRHSRHGSTSSSRSRASGSTPSFKAPSALRHQEQSSEHPPAPPSRPEEHLSDGDDGMVGSPRKQVAPSARSASSNSLSKNPHVSSRKSNTAALERPCGMEVDFDDNEDKHDMEVDSPFRNIQHSEGHPHSRSLPKNAPFSIARDKSLTPSQSPVKGPSAPSTSARQATYPSASQTSRGNPPVLGMRRKAFTPYSAKKSTKPSPPATSSTATSQVRPITSNTQSASSSSTSPVAHMKDSSAAPTKSSTLPATRITPHVPQTPRKAKSQITFVADPLSPSRRHTGKPPVSPSKKEKRPGASHPDVASSSRKPITMSASSGSSPFVDLSTKTKSKVKSQDRPHTLPAGSKEPRTPSATLVSQPRAPALPPEPDENVRSVECPSSDDIDISFSYDLDELEDVLRGLDGC